MYLYFKQMGGYLQSDMMFGQITSYPIFISTNIHLNYHLMISYRPSYLSRPGHFPWVGDKPKQRINTRLCELGKPLSENPLQSLNEAT